MTETLASLLLLATALFIAAIHRRNGAIWVASALLALGFAGYAPAGGRLPEKVLAVPGALMVALSHDNSLHPLQRAFAWLRGFGPNGTGQPFSQQAGLRRSEP